MHIFCPTLLPKESHDHDTSHVERRNCGTEKCGKTNNPTTWTAGVKGCFNNFVFREES